MSDLTGKRVLVVEDEPLIAMGLVDDLSSAGLTVVGPAHTVSHGIALIEANDIDAAILDVNLGAGLTSVPVADALRARAIPFLYLTGHGDLALREQDRSTIKLDKPYDEKIFLQAVTSLLTPSSGRH